MDILTAPTGTQAIDRAARILTYVLEGEGRMTVGALSEAANLPKSTTSRLVGALERQGLLRRDLDDGSLQAGPAIDAYARRARLDPDLPNIARDLLESIATVTGETATLSIPTSKGVDQIAQAEGAYLLGSTNWIGRTVPFHASAVGKTFLAFGAATLPPGPLEALTPKTLIVRGDLVRDLEQTRQRGWGISIEEIEPGLVAIGAPVRGPDLRVITGIALAGPSMRITPDRYEQIGELLIRSAAELTVRLSHHHLEEGAA
jgi:IclR family transcriptional regulator, acetate operon repressor